MKGYFYDLNYTLANEDTTLEYEMVKSLRPKAVLSVCGSGARVLPLITRHTERLDAVDISDAQLRLLSLRVETISRLNHDGFLKFWAYPPYRPEHDTDFRKAVFKSLHLHGEVREFFNTILEKNGWGSILYQGKWENTFMALSRICRAFLGKACDDVFMFNSLREQREYFNSGFPWRRWRLILFILGNRSIFNALLYKGRFVRKNVRDSHFAYYNRAFKNIFNNIPARESFFLQLCLLGRLVYPEGNPIEAGREVFERIKTSLHTATLNTINKDLISALNSARRYDFVSLSDLPSYFTGELERDYLRMIRPGINPGGVVVLRFYLREPDADQSGYEDITSGYQGLIEKEAVQMYRIKMLRRL